MVVTDTALGADRIESWYGVILILLGIACNAMAATISGSDVKDFVSGLLMGLSVAEMLAGIVIIGNSILKKQ